MPDGQLSKKLLRTSRIVVGSLPDIWARPFVDFPVLLLLLELVSEGLDAEDGLSNDANFPAKLALGVLRQWF